MKKLCMLAFLLCALLLPFAGHADNMISLRQLNERLPTRWKQSYQTKWRKISVDTMPYVPQAETFPILKMVPDFTVPDVSGLSKRWTSGIREGAGFYISLEDHHRAENETKGETQTFLYYPPFENGRAYAEHNDLTIGEAIDYLKQVMDTIRYGEWRYDRPHKLQVNLTTSKKSGEALIPEGYSFSLMQEMGGIPVLCHVLDGVDEPRDEVHRLFISLLYQVRDFDAIAITGQKLRLTDILAEDVPLLDFSQIRESIEQEIMAGHIRKIFDVELGYALYNEPGASRKPGYEWIQSAVFYALPVWAVRCHYVDGPTKELRDYLGLDVPERAVMEYKTVLINAQTGKMIDRLDNRREASDYPGFLSWEKANVRP